MSARQGTYWADKLNRRGFHAFRCCQSAGSYSVWCDCGDGGAHLWEVEDVRELLRRMKREGLA